MVSNISSNYLIYNKLNGNVTSETSDDFAELLNNAKSSKPNIKEFMDKTNVNFKLASEMLYGVIGSNVDVRDWGAIMSSQDPLMAARQATNAMYNSGGDYAKKSATTLPDTNEVTYTIDAKLKDKEIIQKNGNFALTQSLDDSDNVVAKDFMLIDSSGVALRQAGNTSSEIAKNAWLFGFDISETLPLATSASALSTTLGQNIQNAQNLAITKNSFEPYSSINTQDSLAAISALKSQLGTQENVKSYLQDLLKLL